MAHLICIEAETSSGVLINLKLIIHMINESFILAKVSKG